MLCQTFEQPGSLLEANCHVRTAWKPSCYEKSKPSAEALREGERKITHTRSTQVQSVSEETFEEVYSPVTLGIKLISRISKMKHQTESFLGTLAPYHQLNKMVVLCHYVVLGSLTMQWQIPVTDTIRLMWYSESLEMQNQIRRTNEVPEGEVQRV